MSPFRLALITALAGALLAASTVVAAPDESAKASPLDTLKKLVGTWEGSEAGKDGKPQSVVYRLTGAGSAVEESLFPGSDHEMVTMYTMDGEDLVLTHYCALGNQPHMKAKTPIAPGRIDFEFVSGGNMKSRDEMHMDSLSMTFPDADHVNSEWRLWKDGKVAKVVSLAFTRKKA